MRGARIPAIGHSAALLLFLNSVLHGTANLTLGVLASMVV